MNPYSGRLQSASEPLSGTLIIIWEENTETQLEFSSNVFDNLYLPIVARKGKGHYPQNPLTNFMSFDYLYASLRTFISPLTCPKLFKRH